MPASTTASVEVSRYGHIVRRGCYDVDDLQVFNRRQRGGIYWYRGGLNPRTLILWSIAVVVGMLFSVNDAYTGPFVPLLGGIDGGFIASGLVALIGCPIIHRFWPDKPEVYGPQEVRISSKPVALSAASAERS